MEHKQKGLECLAAGNDKEAREHFQKAVEISPDVAYRLITVKKLINILNLKKYIILIILFFFFLI